VNELWKQLHFFQQRWQCHFRHHKTWQLKLPKLAHALFYPKPAGPFSQVGDDQMLALDQLAAIFEGALPLHK
jgi:hypothetical protein